jgi:hypothetical protein
MKLVTITALCCLLVIASSSAFTQRPAADSERFRRFDKNGDGKITPDELDMPVAFKAADQNGDGSVTPNEFVGYLQQRPGDRRSKTVRRPAPVPATGAEDLRVQREIPYRDPSGVESSLLSLDIYAPKDAENLPVMIYIHGGGWQRGDKAAVGSKPAYFCSRGWVFVSLNYRFVPAVDLLTQLQDSADAIAWVHTHIADHGGDPQQLHLMGHSAGAHHVAILATNERFLKAAGKELSILKSVVELDTQALDVPRMMHGSRNRGTYAQAFGKDERLGGARSRPCTTLRKAKESLRFFWSWRTTASKRSNRPPLSKRPFRPPTCGATSSRRRNTTTARSTAPLVSRATRSRKRWRGFMNQFAVCRVLPPPRATRTLSAGSRR